MSDLVVYLKGSAEMRQDVTAALNSPSHTLIECRNVEEVLDQLKRVPPKLIIVDGSAGDREASQRVVELSTCSALFAIPVMLVSKQADKRADTLADHYKRVIPVNIPFTIEAFNQAVSYGLGGPPPAEVPVDKSAVAKKEAAAAKDVGQLKETAVAKEAVPLKGRHKRLEENTPRIRARLRENPDPARLKNSVGGEAFALARDPEDFVDESLLPKDFAFTAFVQEVLNELNTADPWLATHARRIAFVSAAIAKSLGFSAERDAVIRLAGVAMPYGLKDVPAEIQRYDLIKDPSREIALELASLYRQSAQAVRQRTGSEQAAQRVELAANLLVGESRSDDPQVLQDAATVMAVELCARSCWGNGAWSPQGAYRAIRFFRNGSLGITDKKVKSSIIRAMGEAVTMHVTVGNSFLSHLDDSLDAASQAVKKLVEEASTLAKNRAAKEGAQTKEVNIAELTPGMLLLGPVLAKDGRVVLQPNILLDENIVFDLWQLAAVRALELRVVVALQPKPVGARSRAN